MLLSSSWITAVALVWLTGVAHAEETAISIDFYTDVQYDPPDAWFTETNDACNTVGHYTAQVNASASVTFQGDRVEIFGLQNNASGILAIAVDNLATYEVDLRSDNISCDLFVDYYLGFGVHNMTLTLVGPSLRPISAGEGGSTQPVLHLTDITYWVPGADTSGSISTNPTTPTAKSANVGAIVGATVGGVAFVVAVSLGLFYYFKKRMPWSRKGRHSFDPTVANTVYITELSPRSPRSPTSPKFQPYSRMDDDQVLDTKTASLGDGHLGVPSLSYAAARGGLRSRSRSPNPDASRNDETA